jgi:hypothetical protein
MSSALHCQMESDLLAEPGTDDRARPENFSFDALPAISKSVNNPTAARAKR